MAPSVASARDWSVSVLVRWRRAPICPAPALGCQRSLWLRPPTALGVTSIEDHDDSRIAPEALAQLLTEFRTIAADHDEPSAQPLRTRRGHRSSRPDLRGTTRWALPRPLLRTHLPLVHPVAVTPLAVVLVSSTRQRRRPACCPTGEALADPIPVPWDAEEPKASQADRPATPEWVVRDQSHDSVSSVGCQY